MPTTLLTAAVFLLAGCASPSEPAASARRAAPYPCDGCEITDAANPDTLGPTVRLADADEPGERLVIEGRVVLADRRTPAAGVVVYAHQTGADGLYGPAERGVALQGWLRTDADGRYRIETVRPGPYPDADLPAHVHLYIREPDRAPYYVNDVVFSDDPKVTAAYRASLLPGPDDGIVTLARGADGWRAQRDVILPR